MTTKLKLTPKDVANRMVVPDDDTGRFVCPFCNKMYVVKKVAVNHVKMEHQDELQEAWVDHLLRDGCERIWMEYEFLVKHIERRLISYRDELVEIINKIKQDPIHAAEWYTEKMVKGQVKSRAIEKVQLYLSESVGVETEGEYKSRANTASLVEELEIFADGFKAEIETMKQNLLNRPYGHSSTSLMANAVNEWTVGATSELVGSTWGGEFNDILHAVESIISIHEQLELAEKVDNQDRLMAGDSNHGK